MGYITTTLGMKLADPSTVQDFETVEVNADFLILEEAILEDRTDIAAIQGGAGRGSRAIYYVADLDGVALILDEVEGDLCYVDEGNFYLRRDDADWAQATPGTFADVAARDAAFAKAAAAYLVTGATARIGQADYLYSGTAWGPGSGPYLSLTKSAPQPLALAATTYPIVWETEVSDAWGMHDPANPDRLIAPITGVYEVTVGVYCNAGSGATALTALMNATTNEVLGAYDRRAGSAAAGTPLSATFSVTLTAGEYIRIALNSTIAASQVSSGPGAQTPIATMKYIGPIA